MKKKLLSLALALVLCLSLTVPALAAEEGKADSAPSTEEKKDETPAEGEEKKDETPAEGEKKDEAPAEGEEKKDEAPAEGEKKDETPAEGEKKDEAPAEGEKKDEASAAAPKFTDVEPTSAFAAAIDWAVEQGITTGKTETTFGPTDPCTVSHILTFLWRANGKPGAAEGVKDRDAAAKWAVEQKLIAEDQDVSATCTRAMAVTFMWKVAGSPEADASKLAFTDFAAEDSFAPAIAWAVEQGVTKGTSDTAFSPDKGCSRGQIVTFLYRANQAAEAAKTAE